MKDDKLQVARMEALCTPQHMYKFLVPIYAMDNSVCHILRVTDHSLGGKNKFQLPESNKEIAVRHVRQLL